MLAHVGLGADHHGADRPAPPGACRGDGRRPRDPPAGRLAPRLRRPRLPAQVGRRRADPRARRGDRIAGPLLGGRARRLRPRSRDRDAPRQLVSTEISVGELDLAARATANAELAALQAQIEPHFLFNALNTIAAFCRTQPDEARELVLAFADYCRWTLPPAGGVRRPRPRSSSTSRRTSRSSGPASATRSRSSCASRRPPAPCRCRRSWCSRSSRTRSSTARPTARCASSSAPRCASAGCA